MTPFGDRGAPLPLLPGNAILLRDRNGMLDRETGSLVLAGHELRLKPIGPSQLPTERKQLYDALIGNTGIEIQHAIESG